MQAVTLVSTDSICAGQQASVPQSGMVARRLDVGSADLSRMATGDYVALSASNDEFFVYFSFDPSLPIAPDTEIARDLLTYAYVDFQLKQSATVGGSLELLSDLTLLHLDDFETFEIRGGQLVWRLARQSSDHYFKFLSLYDQDPSNDPNPSNDCVSGDILGMCACEFTGPTINVTVDGSLQL
ncbi:MAG TPA: hypothetical protein VG963_29170 [Polyangiaceae bacterium]|nr:hypothetical protein [Polyangiaceae bacterium]